MNSPFQPTQQEYKPPASIACKWCDKPIFIGDRSVYIHHGEIGRGSKSGQPVVKDADSTSGDAVVHELCAIGYMSTQIVDSSEEAESAIDTLCADIFGMTFTEMADHQNFCAACDVELEDE
jgi:hypothetical protein